MFPVSFLRVARLCKLSRLAKAFHLFPELRLMMAGLIGCSKAIFWGSVLLMFCLIVWSIIAVQFIHPLNSKIAETGAYADCDRCARAYSTVFQATLTFWQQIVAGDSWGTITITVIEHYPETVSFYMLVFLSVGMAVLNLILGVVVDVASQGRDKLKEEMEKDQLMLRLEYHHHLVDICREMDHDGDGRISEAELHKFWTLSATFREAMSGLDITEQDIAVLWAVIDPDKVGTVSYTEFVESCYKLKSSNTTFVLAYLKFYITEIKNKVCDAIEGVKTEMIAEERKIEQETEKIEKELRMSPRRMSPRRMSPRQTSPNPRGQADDNGLNAGLSDSPLQSEHSEIVRAGETEAGNASMHRLIADAKEFVGCLTGEFEELVDGIKQLNKRIAEAVTSKEVKDAEPSEVVVKTSLDGHLSKHEEKDGLAALPKSSTVGGDQSYLDLVHVSHQQQTELMAAMEEVKQRLLDLRTFSKTSPLAAGQPGAVPHERFFDYWRAPSSCCTEGAKVRVLELPSGPATHSQPVALQPLRQDLPTSKARNF
jgi:hypothetical protein